MEQTKRTWNIVRVIYFMIRKGISKRKLLLDLNLFLKRGNKIASKAIKNLKFHPTTHNNNNNININSDLEYEFSCSNTPNYTLPFHVNKRRHHYSNLFGCAFHVPETREDELATMNAVRLALEMLNSNSNNGSSEGMVEASPYLPGFGRSPMVRQLRITDSPFPLSDDGDNGYVDKKAEEYIERFYKELRKQSW